MKRTRLLGAAAGLVALVGGFSGCTVHAPRATKPSPSVSHPQGPLVPQLSGDGPFVVFNQNVGNDNYRAFVIDLSTRRRVELAGDWYAAEQGSEYNLDAPQVWGQGVPILAEGWLALLGRAPSSPIKIEGRILQFSASPDAESVIALVKKHEKDRSLELLRFSSSGSQPIAEPPAVVPWVDGDYSMAPTVWLPDSTWLAQGRCACDYGSPTQGWYRLTDTGKLTRETRLGFPGPSLSASRDGRFISWLDIPQKPCGPHDDTCPNGPMKIVIADAVKRTIRRFGSYANDLGRGSSAIMAPNGDRLAGVLGGHSVIRVLDAVDGRTLATASYKIENLRVLTFLDDQTILAQGDDGSSTHNRTTLLVFHLSGNNPPHVDRIVSGDLYFSGWVR
jgi:hypothetical protein